MPSTKIIRTYSFIEGGVEQNTVVEEVKLEHIHFDLDSLESGECPVCIGSMADDGTCPDCGFNKDDTEETMIEKWEVWSAKQ